MGSCFQGLTGGISMTDFQKKKIADLREKGFGYLRIAKMLGISPNTIKSYCRRNNLQGRRGVIGTDMPVGQVFCKRCGSLLSVSPNQKSRKFCSDSCRLAWWKDHPELLNKKAFYQFNCACCGSSFDSYGNKKRKYCSHSCYIKARFGSKKP